MRLLTIFGAIFATILSLPAQSFDLQQIDGDYSGKVVGNYNGFVDTFCVKVNLRPSYSSPDSKYTLTVIRVSDQVEYHHTGYAYVTVKENVFPYKVTFNTSFSISSKYVSLEGLEVTTDGSGAAQMSGVFYATLGKRDAWITKNFRINKAIDEFYTKEKPIATTAKKKECKIPPPPTHTGNSKSKKSSDGLYKRYPKNPPLPKPEDLTVNGDPTANANKSSQDDLAGVKESDITFGFVFKEYSDKAAKGAGDFYTTITVISDKIDDKSISRYEGWRNSKADAEKASKEKQEKYLKMFKDDPKQFWALFEKNKGNENM